MRLFDSFMGIISFLRERLYSHNNREASENPSRRESFSGSLRAALLKCETLTESEVDEYIAYTFERKCTVVPLDYVPDPDGCAEVTELYTGCILTQKFLWTPTIQISPETLKKVSRVLPMIYRPELRDKYMHFLD